MQVSRQLQSSLSLSVFMQLTQQWQDPSVRNDNTTHGPQQQTSYGRTMPAGRGA